MIPCRARRTYRGVCPSGQAARGRVYRPPPAILNAPRTAGKIPSVSIEDNVPVLREVLEEPRNDQAFTATVLLKLAPAVDMELNEKYQGVLRSLAPRN